MGFALLVAGTAVYAQADHLSSHSEADLMARLRILRRRPRLNGGAAAGAGIADGSGG